MSEEAATGTARGGSGGDVGSTRVPVRLPAGVSDPATLATALEGAGYLPDEGLATAAYLALALRRPLFLEGDAGVGKTAIAQALAMLGDGPLIRLQCYEGIDAAQALYDWNFPRQVLHLRSAEVAGRTTAPGADAEGPTTAPGADAGARTAEALEAELYDRRFLVARPILQAIETPGAVLLIDEVDRADDEFEALLLEVLSEFSVSIPELGTIRATDPPLVVLTSNRTREVHDALKRRCYYHWVDHPDFDREVAIVRMRLPGTGERLAREVTAAVHALRGQDLLKPPGVAETLDWAEALVALGADHLDAAKATATLGSVLKFREDLERVRAMDVGDLVERALTGT